MEKGITLVYFRLLASFISWNLSYFVLKSDCCIVGGLGGLLSFCANIGQ